MKYTKLGNSDLNVSRICMGCMGFGDAGRGQHSWTLDEEHSREIIKRGLELGVNFYDTAIAYQSGTSEQYVGRAAVMSVSKKSNSKRRIVDAAMTVVLLFLMAYQVTGERRTNGSG